MQPKKKIMSTSKKKIVVGIAAGLALIVGFEIGVQLYDVTDKSNYYEAT